MTTDLKTVDELERFQTIAAEGAAAGRITLSERAEMASWYLIAQSRLLTTPEAERYSELICKAEGPKLAGRRWSSKE